MKTAKAKRIIEALSVGEAVHTAFRKGGQSREADQIWKLIQQMPDDDWGRVVDFIKYGFEVHLAAFDEHGAKD
jgi:hypothetical protein